MNRSVPLEVSAATWPAEYCEALGSGRFGVTFLLGDFEDSIELVLDAHD